jgi:O-acetyl-ADP-ribose deacetylase (regulator of RNase III)
MKNLKRYILMIMVSLMFFSFSGCLPEDTTGDKEAVEAEDNKDNNEEQNVEKSGGDNTDDENKDNHEEENDMSNPNQLVINKTKLTILQGDITKVSVDAIVNAANEKLQGGGGVDGAIGRAAGREIYAECKAILDERKITALPTGEAVVTSAGKMANVKFIIHTPGPRWTQIEDKELAAKLLKSSYANSLALAKEKSCKTVAFPSISTGVFAYPLDQAADIAVSTAIETVKKGEYTPEEIIFVLFGQKEVDAYLSIFAKYKK